MQASYEMTVSNLRQGVSKNVLVCIFLCVAISSSVALVGCPRGQRCNHASSDALERYTSFVEAISKGRRSATSRLHRRSSSRKRSTYEYANSISYNEPPVRINPPRGLRINSPYTTVQRNLYDEEKGAVRIRIMQAQRLRVLNRIRQSKLKPWWGQWSSWSACGRTCGSGVQFQERHCLGARHTATRKNGKILCVGPSKKYRLCNSAPCPTDTPSFRRLQCSQRAARQVRGRYYKWKPYGHPVDEIVSNQPCQLVCVSNVNNLQLNTIAMDGTECRKGWDDGRCVEGKCQLIGCDGKINSTKLRDRCGKCDEEQTTCVVHDKVLLHGFDAAGEKEMVRIPEGAYDIMINERRKTSASIVIKDDNGTLLFNGGGESSSGLATEGWPSNIWIAGAEFRYRRPTLQSSAGGFEYILTTTPIRHAIVIFIRAKHAVASMMHYEFKTPIQKTPIATTATAETAEVTKPDNGSNELQPFLPSTTSIPERIETTTESHVIVLAKPQQPNPGIRVSVQHPVILAPARTGNTLDQPVVPEIVEYSFVEDVDDGYYEEGEEFLVVRVFEETPIEPVGNNQVEDNITSNDSLKKHEGNDAVFAKPGFRFVTATGENVEDRDRPRVFVKPVLIRAEEDETRGIAGVETVERQMPTYNETIYEEIPGDEGEDVEDNPEDGGEDYDEGPEYGGGDYDTVPGVDIAIPGGSRIRGRYGHQRYIGYFWRTNGFAPCSSTCTSGLQDSYAVCKRSRDHQTVEDAYCDPTTRPEPVRKSCSNQTCEPRWEATPWSECSLSCGTGVQMRSVRCWRMIGPGFDSTLYNEVCNDVAGDKPDETKPCKIVDHCGPLWESSDWSPCPAPCGRIGAKRRTVRCSAGRDDLCASTQRPHTTERCYGPKCALTWIATDWGPCSGVCGGGRKARRVICSDHTGRRHPDDHCDIDTKPVTSHPCGDRNCRPEWIAQEWNACSAPCGEGNKTRNVLCSGIVNGEVHHYDDDTPCSGTTKPLTHEPCQLKECDPVWFTTSWSKCSVTCGNGHRVREVKCYLNNAPATRCDLAAKPPQREACNMPPCPTPPAAQCRNKSSVNCALVVRVRLCSHWYYKSACCSSCQSRRPRGK